MAESEARELLRLAATSIQRQLERPGSAAWAEHPLPREWTPAGLSPPLQAPAATFVTLKRGSELRGCCGSVRAFEPLACNVVRSALTAAFGDRRFPPVRADELPGLDLHVAILSPPTPLSFLTESDLLAQLRPGVDGVILVEPDLQRQGLFLPAVWEQLPHPRDFLRRLKLKAGLAADYWSPWLQASRFTVESMHGRLADWLAPATDGDSLSPRSPG